MMVQVESSGGGFGVSMEKLVENKTKSIILCRAQVNALHFKEIKGIEIFLHLKI